MRKIKVTFVVERHGAGNGRVWWAAFQPTDAVIVGEGSGERVVIRKDAQPRWLPKPTGRETYISRAKGTRVDGEAWVELEEGTLLRCGAECAGGFRCAQVRSPVLVVEEGAVWEAEHADGTRSVYVRVLNARPLRVEEVQA